MAAVHKIDHAKKKDQSRGRYVERVPGPRPTLFWVSGLTRRMASAHKQGNRFSTQKTKRAPSDYTGLGTEGKLRGYHPMVKRATRGRVIWT